MHPSKTLSCLVAINGLIGNKSEAAFPALKTISFMQPTNDSIMYLTPCSFSSGLKPKNKINLQKKNSVPASIYIYIQFSMFSYLRLYFVVVVRP